MRISDWIQTCALPICETCLGSTGEQPARRQSHHAPALSYEWRGGWRTDKRSAASPHRTPRSPWPAQFQCRHACPWGRWRARWHRCESLSEPTDKARSEEHTSELQSLMRISYAVFFLTKKKKHID